jgi:hypothetical protein
MQWPCTAWYHVPTNVEWAAIKAVWWGSDWVNLSNTLKLPFAGYRDMTNGTLYNQDWTGYYWSSSPWDYSYGYFLSLYDSGINASNHTERANGYSIRCIKNN